MRRVFSFLGGLVPAMLGGAFFVVSFAGVVDPGKPALGGLVVGALCGAAVVGLIRLFRIAPFGYAAAGLVCGPLPFLVLSQGDGTSGDDRFRLWLVGAFFGLLIGVLEWARVRRLEADRVE